jgi:type IV pilus assembly protein PilY1
MNYSRQITIVLAIMACSVSVRADDIDVYISTQSTTGGIPLVMFTLDVRPNVLSSTVCNGEECDFLRDEEYLPEDGPVTYFQLLIAALKKTFNDIRNRPTAPLFKIGFMIPHDDGPGGDCAGPQVGGNKCTNGAYVLSGFRWVADNPNTPADESGELAEFFTKLEALPIDGPGNAAHEYQGTEIFFELYRYLIGADVYNGHNGWRDFGTNNTLNLDDPDDTNPGDAVAELTWDQSAQVPNEKRYASPLADVGDCASVYTLNFAFAVSSQDDDSNSEVAQPTADAGLNYTPESNKPYKEIIGKLNGTDLADGNFGTLQALAGNQNITSYFLVKGTQGVLNRANEWAQAGGTGTAFSLSDDPESIARILDGILNEVLSVSTTFVAPSVPANVYNRSQTLNEVFIAVFEPDDAELPFWVGNLKKLITRDIEVAVLDQNGDPVLDGQGNPVTEPRTILVDTLNASNANPVQAVNPLDGRIRKEAVTYWTDVASLPAAPAGGDSDYNDDTDGREVSRGGAGQNVPGFVPGADPGLDNTSSRKVFTEPATHVNGSAANLLDLNADAPTAIDLLQNSPALYQTVMDCSSCSYTTEPDTVRKTEAEAKTLNMIKFARGYDVPFDAAAHAAPPGRAWWVADPLHSRPLALNFGERGAYSGAGAPPDIRLIMAGNGGVLHMFRDKEPAGTESGAEAWSFIPREFMPLQRRLMENDLGIYNPGIPSITGPRKPLHPYAFDGSASALIIDNNLDGNIDVSDNDKVYVFIGLRRGGKAYYALDISDPDQPKLLWTLRKGDTGFTELAQSWSLMRAGLISFTNASSQIENVPALFFGGGYNGDDDGDGVGDLGKDSRLFNANANTEILGTDDFEGNAIFVADARDGSLVWKAAGPSSTTDSGNGWSAADLTYEVSTLKDSVATGIALFDSDGDRIVDRFYLPDTGGNLWRGDIVPGDRDNWTLTKVLSVGRHFQADNANDRRFFARVDVARAREPDNSQAEVGAPFDAVALISGDRAHPLGEVVENWAYIFKDRNIVSGSPPSTTLTHDDLQDLTNNCLQDGNNSDCTDLVNGDLPKLANGWKIRLNHCEDLSTGTDCGEKGLARPLIIQGTVFFTTYIPPEINALTTSCGPKEGTGLFYAVSLFDASAVLDFNLSNNTDTDIVNERIDKLASPGIPPEAVSLAPNLLLRPDLEPQPVPARSNAPTFWYERFIR